MYEGFCRMSESFLSESLQDSLRYPQRILDFGPVYLAISFKYLIVYS